MFAFQNYTRCKRITSIMHVGHLYLLTYHFIHNRLPSKTKGWSPAWITWIRVQLREKKLELNVSLIIWMYMCLCGGWMLMIRPPTIRLFHKQLHLWWKVQLVEILFLQLQALSGQVCWNKSRTGWWLLIIILSRITLKYRDRWCYLY